VIFTTGEKPLSKDGEINYLAGPTPRSNVAKDMVSSLASIPEAHETGMSGTMSAEHPLEAGTCDGLVLVRYKDTRQPFWRQSMTKMSDYYMAGGVKGKLMRLQLQAQSANKVSAPIENPVAPIDCPQASQGTIETARDVSDESKLLGETPPPHQK
jgi:hypothetical protein